MDLKGKPERYENNSQAYQSNWENEGSKLRMHSLCKGEGWPSKLPNLPNCPGETAWLKYMLYMRIKSYKSGTKNPYRSGTTFWPVSRNRCEFVPNNSTSTTAIPSRMSDWGIVPFTRTQIKRNHFVRSRLWIAFTLCTVAAGLVTAYLLSCCRLEQHDTNWFIAPIIQQGIRKLFNIPIISWSV